MTQIFFVRHPEAQRPHSESHGPEYGLTEHGVAQAHEVGSWLLEITGNKPTSFECAPSRRSHEAAKIVAGTAGLSTPIGEQLAFERTGRELHEIERSMHEWVFEKNSGLYVAVLSRKAIASCLKDRLGLSMAEVVGEDELLPTGSVTRLSVARGSFDVDYIRLSPQDAAQFKW